METLGLNFTIGQFYQVFKDSIIPVLHKLFLRIKNDEPFNIRFFKQIFILEQFWVHSKIGGKPRHLLHPSGLPSPTHSFPYYQHPRPEFPTTFYMAGMTQILILEIEKLHTNLIQKQRKNSNKQTKSRNIQKKIIHCVS